MEENNQNTAPDDNLNDILIAEISKNGGEWKEDPNSIGRDGTTMFDMPTSKDNLITVIIPKANIRNIGAHSIVKIGSRTSENGGDGREYRAIVVAGPFHEPDGIRADAPMMISSSIHGAIFMPNYHGKVQVELIGEVKNDMMMPPRFRPLPNSPVFVLSKEETAKALKVSADPGVTLGMAIGHDDIAVQIPTDKKTVLPRHIGILGTTGGGKSTTVSCMMAQFQTNNIATIVIDTEGEYTHVDKATQDDNMKKLLANRVIPESGIKNVKVLHMIGRDTRAASPTPTDTFSLKFSSLSPYAASNILGLNEAQFGRFLKAYDTAKLILRDLKMFPKPGEEQQAIEIDEFETGWPGITLSLLIDVAGMIMNNLLGKPLEPFNSKLKENLDQITPRIQNLQTSHEISWGALLSKLWQLQKPKVFDIPKSNELPFQEMIKPGQVTIVDLSDSDSTVINNIVIANLLRGVQKVQEVAYDVAIKAEKSPTPVSIIIEEAHEFLSREKIGQMSNLFEQVAKIARRGRKRWLGLVFVTQLPQHLPDEVLGLINSFVLHKISDSNVISRLKRSIGGVDDGLWNRLPNLAPGQAIVCTPSLARSLLVAMDPSPCKLLMVD